MVLGPRRVVCEHSRRDTACLWGGGSGRGEKLPPAAGARGQRQGRHKGAAILPLQACADPSLRRQHRLHTPAAPPPLRGRFFLRQDRTFQSFSSLVFFSSFPSSSCICSICRLCGGCGNCVAPSGPYLPWTVGPLSPCRPSAAPFPFSGVVTLWLSAVGC